MGLGQVSMLPVAKESLWPLPSCQTSHCCFGCCAAQQFSVFGVRQATQLGHLVVVVLSATERNVSCMSCLRTKLSWDMIPTSKHVPCNEQMTDSSAAGKLAQTIKLCTSFIDSCNVSLAPAMIA